MTRAFRSGPSRRVRWAAAAALPLLAAACGGTEVADDLTQSEAREAVVALDRAGVPAEAVKASGRGGGYRVVVPRRSYAAAARVLVASDLPRARQATFDDIIGKPGILPQSREVERLRLDRALSVQAESLLRTDPAVRRAVVVVRLHGAEGSDDAGASVAVETESPSDPAALVDAVARAVPGVPRERIDVRVFPARPEAAAEAPAGAAGVTPFFLGVASVPEAEYVPLATLFIVSVVLVGAGGVVLGYWYGVFAGARSGDRPREGERTSRGSLRLERPRRDLTEV